MLPKGRRGLVRPAAAPRRGVRRPAVADEAKDDQEVRKVLADFSIAELSKLGHIWAKTAVYYRQEADVIGKVEGVRVQEGNVLVDL